MATNIVIMGVCGAGKSLIAGRLAAALGLPHIEGDAFHTCANIARMSAGVPLTDAERVEWLDQLAGQLGAAALAGSGAVLSCSALKQCYRERLRRGCEGYGLQFVYLRGSREQLAERLAHRHGHFMPVTLLDSQLADLEEPLPDERSIVCDITATPAQIVAGIVDRLSAQA
ncbi:MAG TPA: gluconokinase [Plasticicumulans sp.]|nr:gluconokinase [Plasticicumulans sp.]